MSTQITIEDDGSIRIRQLASGGIVRGAGHIARGGEAFVSGGGGAYVAAGGPGIGGGVGGAGRISTEPGFPVAGRGGLVAGPGVEPTLIPEAARDGARIALRNVLKTLDGWRETAAQNREAGVGTVDGPESWHTDDIRNMVADTARAVGLVDLAKTIEQEIKGS